ncbi:MAG: phage portal protein, partial [Treponema sp.]|nr:phage portal protein [Treponema sp.]
MNIFKRLITNRQRNNNLPQLQKSISSEKFNGNTLENLSDFNNFSIFGREPQIGETYLLNAWVNIAVNILIRNIARADFTVKNGGEDVTCGPIYDLFHRPNPGLSRFDLWKETAAWWLLEGEAYWWFGPDYSGGLPKELFILDPRKLRHEGEFSGGIDLGFRHTARRWFYHSGTELIPILSDELIQFREWNPWNPVRG